MPKEYGTPGPRAIYPELCDSRSLSKCGIVANALWPRLIAKADDQGRVAGDAADVLGLCFPKMLDRVTHRQIAAALEELERARQIVRYVAGDEPFIQLVTWWQWQHSQRRAYPSRHPAPEGWSDHVYGFAEHPKTFREAGGLPPHVRDLPTASPQDADSESADSPHAADSESAPSPQDADSVRRSRARSRASALPDPTRIDTLPNPSRKREGRGRGRASSDYDALMIRDDEAEEDDAEASFFAGVQA